MSKIYNDSLLDNVRQLLERQAKISGRKFKFKKPPRVFPPTVPQRAYRRDLNSLLVEMKRISNEVIKPSLEPIIKQAISSRPRGDSFFNLDEFVDDIDRVFLESKLIFYRKFTDREIINLVTKAALKTSDFNLDQINRSFKAVLNVQIPGNEPWLAEQIRAFTKTNVSLIKSIPDQFFSRTEVQVTQAAQSGTLGKDLAADISKQYDISENRANLIARDQVAKFNSDLTKARQQGIGIKKYQWSTSLDERVRTSHEEKEGNIYSWDDPPADTGNPGDDVQCRCVAIAVFESSSEDEE